jgi:hypothetical protein
MGQEARCLARIGERVLEVQALLESDELILRGEHRARLPFASLDSVEATDGRLLLHERGEPIVLELGPAAERWAAKIRNPPTLLDKLGVKAGQSIAVDRETDPRLLALLRARVDLVELILADRDTIRDGTVATDLDMVLVQVDRQDDFVVLPAAARAIVQAGAVWVIHPKGRADLKDTDVMAAGKLAGLVDNKVARVSDTHSGLRFVIPKANRRPPPAARR